MLYNGLRGDYMKAEILKVGQAGKISLPADYLVELGIRDQVICFMEEGQLIIRPFFEEQREETKDLLEVLREEGYSGEELLLEYKKRRARRD